MNQLPKNMSADAVPNAGQYLDEVSAYSWIKHTCAHQITVLTTNVFTQKAGYSHNVDIYFNKHVCRWCHTVYMFGATRWHLHSQRCCSTHGSRETGGHMLIMQWT